MYKWCIGPFDRFITAPDCIIGSGFCFIKLFLIKHGRSSTALMNLVSVGLVAVDSILHLSLCLYSVKFIYN